MLLELFKLDRRTEVAKWERSMITLAQLMGQASQTAEVSIHSAREEMGSIISGEAFSLRAIINKAKRKLAKIKADNSRLKKLDSFSS